MDMGWILILFIWLVAPFAQLGIIIYLLVLTDKYKKQIRELERGALRARAFENWLPRRRRRRRQ